MSEETNTNPRLCKKSQSPTKIINTDDKDNIANKNMTEQVSNKSKMFLLSGKLTKEFTEEDELDGISISYREQDKKKIKLMSLDLLLKKIVTENFIEKNPILILLNCIFNINILANCYFPISALIL